MLMEYRKFASTILPDPLQKRVRFVDEKQSFHCHLVLDDHKT